MALSHSQGRPGQRAASVPARGGPDLLVIRWARPFLDAHPCLVGFRLVGSVCNLSSVGSVSNLSGPTGWKPILRSVLPASNRFVGFKILEGVDYTDDCGSIQVLCTSGVENRIFGAPGRESRTTRCHSGHPFFRGRKNFQIFFDFLLDNDRRSYDNHPHSTRSREEAIGPPR